MFEGLSIKGINLRSTCGQVSYVSTIARRWWAAIKGFQNKRFRSSCIAVGDSALSIEQRANPKRAQDGIVKFGCFIWIV
jgi:hypothetical protein